MLAVAAGGPSGASPAAEAEPWEQRDTKEQRISRHPFVTLFIGGGFRGFSSLACCARTVGGRDPVAGPVSSRRNLGNDRPQSRAPAGSCGTRAASIFRF